MKIWRPLKYVACLDSHSVSIATTPQQQDFGIAIDVSCTRIFVRSRDKYGDNAVLWRYVVNVKVWISLPENGEKPIGALRKSQGKFVLFLARQPAVGQDLLIHEVSKSHKTTYHSRYDSLDKWSVLLQRPLHDTTQHSQQTFMPPGGGIRTHDLSRRAAATYALDRAATNYSHVLLRNTDWTCER